MPERESSKVITVRFWVGLFLTMAIVAIFMTVAFWLGQQAFNVTQNYFAFAFGSWIGTGVFFILNYCRQQSEPSIVRHFIEACLPGEVQ